METQGANVRKGVLVVSSVMLTIQFATLAATGVFYFFATSKDYRDFLSDRVLSVFYQTPQEILALRRGHALEVRRSRAQWFESYLNPHATSGDDTSAKSQMKHPFTSFDTAKT